MNIDEQPIGKSNVDLLREIREKISDETKDMTFEQLKMYVDEHLKETIHPNATWH